MELALVYSHNITVRDPVAL